QTFEQTFSDPQVIHGEMVVTVDSPVGPLKLVAPAFKLDKTPATVRTAPPLHGQHTEEGLRWLGYSTEQIHTLREPQAIQGVRREAMVTPSGPPAGAAAGADSGTRAGSGQAQPAAPRAPATGTGPQLEIRELTLSFQTRYGLVQALNGVSLTVGQRERVGVVGESGSGKSVTAQAVLGLVPAAEVSGEIY